MANEGYDEADDLPDSDGFEREGVVDAPDEGEAVTDFLGFTDVFKRVLATADHELKVNNRYLFWSGVGAGGAIGLTFIARVVMTAFAHEKEPGAVGNLVYPIGFVLIVLGRYQLFTENTLTPVTLVLTRLASLRSLLRLWLMVFVGNMVGAILFAAGMAYSTVFDPERYAVAVAIGRHAAHVAWMDIFYRGIIAGWIVAAMVWLVHAMRDSIGRVAMVYLMMYLVGAGGFFHVITSSIEVFFGAFADPGAISFWAAWPDFVLPVFLGNSIGGIVFVAILNYAQFAEHRDSDMLRRYGERMSLRRTIVGGGRD